MGCERYQWSRANNWIEEKTKAYLLIDPPPLHCVAQPYHPHIKRVLITAAVRSSSSDVDKVFQPTGQSIVQPDHLPCGQEFNFEDGASYRDASLFRRRAVEL